MDNILQLLPAVDQKRLNGMYARIKTPLARDDVWFIHTVLAQCFLPYRDPKTRDWMRQNGDYSIVLTSGALPNPRNPKQLMDVGIPYGAKPRLFQSYIATQAVRRKSPIVPVARSMTAMMEELGFEAHGGKNGSISRFKDQVLRFASCNFTIVGPAPHHSGQTIIKAPPVKRFDVWFASNPLQETLWPSEIVLTEDYFHSLNDHAVPYDFRALQHIHNNARAQDIYLWMTQRLCRIDNRKPLFLTWKQLHEMFGGSLSGIRRFKETFRKDLKAARTAYPDAKMEEYESGFQFRRSLPPIPKTKLLVN